MYCARCGSGLGEEQICRQCNWSFNEANIPTEQPTLPSTANGASIASLVCGIGSWITLGGFVVIPVIGVIFGLRGLKSPQSDIAVVGIIINAAGLALSALIVLLFIIVVSSGGTMSPPGSGARCC